MRNNAFKELGMSVVYTDSELNWKFTWTKKSLFLWSNEDEDDWRVFANLSQFADCSDVCKAILFCQSLCEVTKMDSVIKIKSHEFLF